ncbi:hypothetical protein BRO54_2386 [Geobacillus proteiniphilus]|uniref:Uncharacterized protein n=1 Tax=Geobacillus proteiniphilus TaxID=860353 RepID=A0A1Q5SWX1_9BACL|nr:hypothetical protein BRO54_2386 [Geobacillus proteiniphilus]
MDFFSSSFPSSPYLLLLPPDKGTYVKKIDNRRFLKRFS